MRIGDLVSVKRWVEEHDEITEPMVRWWIFRAEENGFSKCLIRIGRRLFLDRQAVESWLEEQRVTRLG